jgi:Ca2+-binding RTX toxin-like protein
LKLYNGNNTAIAGIGHTTIYGGAGNDWLSGDTVPTLPSFASIVGGAGPGSHETLAGGYSALSQDTLWAGAGGGAATLSVTQGNNYLQGGFGPSLLEGGAGNDTLVSGNPNVDDYTSTLTGGSGNESLEGGRFASSHDVLLAGSGNDTMNTFQGNNFLMGGSGNDTVNFNSGYTLNDYVSGVSGNVTIDVSDSETQVGTAVPNPNGSTTLTFTENGHTQTLTYSGPHVVVDMS